VLKGVVGRDNDCKCVLRSQCFGFGGSVSDYFYVAFLDGVVVEVVWDECMGEG